MPPAAEPTGEQQAEELILGEQHIPAPRAEASPLETAPRAEAPPLETAPHAEAPPLETAPHPEASPLEPAPTSAPAPALSEREAKILAFEAKWWKHAGAKEQAIRDAFELSSTRYYQLLNALLDNPAALEQDPVLIGRLRRLRSARARTRRR
ncbi:DUF3263 domain-containing protein [Actinoplanes sp. NBRC 101535]|uniref:DUF3263 domain-containing protein n=1 Tax=Actinoplanes sp. NBRC 101535 TaxID=3032196 RepID=UPI0024A1F6A1|nr:DUF3263 domain-containing protein [Actinoplanes sp. NBRC 101535]GLY08047.1 hypothetical protein Acsp01_84260 [Actinoplanes sp. NBRC 101535]